MPRYAYKVSSTLALLQNMSAKNGLASTSVPYIVPNISIQLLQINILRKVIKIFSTICPVTEFLSNFWTINSLAAHET